MYLGLDCSSKAIHAALLNDDGSLASLAKFAPKIKDMDERMYAMADDLYSFVSIMKVGAAAIESAIFIQNPRTTMQIASVVACAKYALHRAGISVVAADNRVWKKEVLGKGNAGKPDIRAFAESNWNQEFKEQDWADAACIALWLKQTEEVNAK